LLWANELCKGILLYIIEIIESINTAERYSSKNKFFDAFRLAMKYYKFSEGEKQQEGIYSKGSAQYKPSSSSLLRQGQDWL
jgi:hypothetical protein